MNQQTKKNQTYEVYDEQHRQDILDSSHVYGAFKDGKIERIYTGADAVHEIRKRYPEDFYEDRIQILECTQIHCDTLVFYNPNIPGLVFVELKTKKEIRKEQQARKWKPLFPDKQTTNAAMIMNAIIKEARANPKATHYVIYLAERHVPLGRKDILRIWYDNPPAQGAQLQANGEYFQAETISEAMREDLIQYFEDQAYHELESRGYDVV